MTTHAALPKKVRAISERHALDVERDAHGYYILRTPTGYWT